MTIDPYIASFSAATVLATLGLGFWSARKSKTASDFFVAGRSVGVGWNASAISGEYLSAASFMGVAGMVMSSGYDALWYPVCYACGYLFLLLFIAGPLRRFGAYTIPDFAEGRFDSPLFRKIAVVFVLFIGFFYTMPQMKGAGTTLAYIFQDIEWGRAANGEVIKGLPYWVGVVLVGSVITLNVALGGMKGITLVQAFQYWLKVFAISVPIFVLMGVYGNYGKQVGAIGRAPTVVPEEKAGAVRKELPPKAPPDQSWVNPFGPLTTKAAKAAAAALTNRPANIPLRPDLAPTERMTVNLSSPTAAQALAVYADLTGRKLAPRTHSVAEQLDDLLKGQLSRWNLVKVPATTDSGVRVHADGYFTAVEVKEAVETFFRTNGFALVAVGDRSFEVEKFTSSSDTQRAWLATHERPLALLYTYSLIIALVCGTAGLPHILVRFYTNPDGVAAKKTTMWVMILIGVFYLFPPVFGTMGRNLVPSLYAGVGAKGTDKVVLELPTVLNGQVANTAQVGKWESGKVGELSGASNSPADSPTSPLSATNPKKSPQGSLWASVLSGITCAGAFAAFMSTFSGLLVSMTGAMAHDVYGRILRPKSTPQQRMRMFKVAAVGVGAIAILLGTLVENFEINFMVGQAFAIAASSYFPLLFMAVWWRRLTMKGAAAGMLTGGLLAVAAISLTSWTTFIQTTTASYAQKKLAAPGWLQWMQTVSLESFWAAHPLLRILGEQPAIWAVPLAITLMFIVSRLTQREVPGDIRMKMLVLHAPEQLGLKQEYIQEHQVGH